MKICKTCELELGAGKFAGTRTICRLCTNKRARENYHNNKDSRKENRKAWRIAHPDYWKERLKTTDPKKKREYQRKWDHSNPEKLLLIRARRRAKVQNIPFNLELNDIVIPQLCPVLGLELKISNTGKLQNYSPSLDKINPKLGYVKGNVRVISWRANTLKNNATLEELEKVTNDLRQITYSSDIP